MIISIWASTSQATLAVMSAQMLVVTTTTGAMVPGTSLLAGTLLSLPHAVINTAAMPSPLMIERVPTERDQCIG